MKNFLKRIAIILITVVTLSLNFVLVGCTDNTQHTQNDFEFTEEVLTKINDDELSKEILDYCNKFYKHYLKECKKNLYIENDEISSTVASNLQNKMQEKMLPIILLGEKEARDIVAFYLPFQKLGTIRAQEYLDTKYEWVWIDGELTPTNPSPLTSKYINGISEQFEILKQKYFK